MRALHLQALPDQIQREHAALGEHAGHDSGESVPRAEREMVDLAERRTKSLVCGEEETHIRHDLHDRGGAAPEEARRPLVSRDIPNGRSQRRVYPLFPLRGEPSAKEVEWVGDRGGSRSGKRAGDERFGGGRQASWESCEGLCSRAVCCELDSPVADVEKLGGDIALPKPLCSRIVSILIYAPKRRTERPKKIIIIVQLFLPLE
jgi:hypothetical protein